MHHFSGQDKALGILLTQTICRQMRRPTVSLPFREVAARPEAVAAMSRLLVPARNRATARILLHLLPLLSNSLMKRDSHILERFLATEVAILHGRPSPQVNTYIRTLK